MKSTTQILNTTVAMIFDAMTWPGLTVRQRSQCVRALVILAARQLRDKK